MPFGTGSMCALSPASMLASTSAMANTPIATTTKSMPPSSSDWPKMKRACAENRSVPIDVSHSPRNSAINPLINDGPDSRTTSARPRHISAKYSGDENCSANSATGGATSVSSRMPTVPATNEAIAAMPSAGPARPLRAMAWPSMQVTTDDDFAWDVEQDRGGRAAVFRAIINAGQHDDAAGRIHLERQRQQQRDRCRRAEPRQDADDGAEETSDEAPQQVVRLKRDRETVQQSAEHVHVRTRTRRPGAPRSRQTETRGRSRARRSPRRRRP